MIRRHRDTGQVTTTAVEEKADMTPLRRRFACIAVALALVMTALAPAAAQAEPASAWALSVVPIPAHFVSGGPPPRYVVVVTNVGGAATSSPITITDTLPVGLSATSASVVLNGTNFSCTTASQTVTCTIPESVKPGRNLFSEIFLIVDPGLAEGTVLSNAVSITGGGALEARASTDVMISSADPNSFDFLPEADGLSASVLSADGSSPSQAGSHPDQMNVMVNFPVRRIGRGGGSPSLAGSDGGVHDLTAILPPGLILNPQATAHCTEAQLETNTCPDASQVGTLSIRAGLFGSYGVGNEPFFNMVPPPGVAASFAFNAVGVEVFPHLLSGAVVGDYPGHYSLSGSFKDTLSLSNDPLFGGLAQFWGDPSADSHRFVRGNECAFLAGIRRECPVPHQTKPLLSLPSACQSSLTLNGKADSWGHPGVFHERSVLFTDSLGNPTGVTGCSALEFSPTLKARPTTTVADSPSGLEADLHIPQTNDLNTLAVANLKDAVVTLPEGLVVNPSSANGLGGCSPAQAGIDPATGMPNEEEPACPDSSKIGTAEVDTPLLDHPLPGGVYLATPHENPFNSLLAIYVLLDDPASGTVIKLAGHVEADPNTGRLTTTFLENPQLPFEDFKLDFFGGPGGPLRTPAVCGTYQTTSQLSPWSGNPASEPPPDTYAISQSPVGGSCPTSQGARPNSPSLDAGSVTPIAAAQTPAVVTLRRNDGSQEFSKVNLTLPPGMTGRLAGVGSCPDAALAGAEAKSGREEQQNPSCPASSKIGTVDVSAGAGPAPYHTQGTAYLTGPYKGAPLGMAIVTPAVAGPYDLGTVVSRVALNLDPNTAQITATSDEIPHILAGIPLDIRQIAIKLDRPNFTRNGTSCNPFAFAGQLTSTLGGTAPLSERFQLGECGALSFKPKLAIRLNGGTGRGAHPALRGILSMPEGGANLAQAAVALPHSEFLDQSHIGTVCTRVQFAAKQCPAASIYGSAVATSPLLSYSLEGPVYLRSSSHELPDLVLALHGPAYQPIEVDAVGRIDSVKGGIRTTFEDTPDVPVSTVVLSMQGGAKGLLQNSTNICKGIHKATAELDGQNGKATDLSPALKSAKCPKPKRHHKNHHRHAAR